MDSIVAHRFDLSALTIIELAYLLRLNSERHDINAYEEARAIVAEITRRQTAQEGER